jgi:hypothetical protein
MGGKLDKKEKHNNLNQLVRELIHDNTRKDTDNSSSVYSDYLKNIKMKKNFTRSNISKITNSKTFLDFTKIIANEIFTKSVRTNPNTNINFYSSLLVISDISHYLDENFQSENLVLKSKSENEEELSNFNQIKSANKLIFPKGEIKNLGKKLKYLELDTNNFMGKKEHYNTINKETTINLISQPGENSENEKSILNQTNQSGLSLTINRKSFANKSFGFEDISLQEYLNLETKRLKEERILSNRENNLNSLNNANNNNLNKSPVIKKIIPSEEEISKIDDIDSKSVSSSNFLKNLNKNSKNIKNNKSTVYSNFNILKNKHLENLGKNNNKKFSTTGGDSIFLINSRLDTLNSPNNRNLSKTIKSEANSGRGKSQNIRKKDPGCFDNFDYFTQMREKLSPNKNKSKSKTKVGLVKNKNTLSTPNLTTRPNSSNRLNMVNSPKNEVSPTLNNFYNYNNNCDLQRDENMNKTNVLKEKNLKLQPPSFRRKSAAVGNTIHTSNKSLLGAGGKKAPIACIRIDIRDLIKEEHEEKNLPLNGSDLRSEGKLNDYLIKFSS